MDMTEVIHQELAHKQLLSSEHLMDSGYIDGKYIVISQKQYGVELIGPVAMKMKEFKERYAKRSGIEGTISQGVRAFDLRVSRYLGL